VSGEAPQAPLPEGVLNPMNGGVEPMVGPSEARLLSGEAPQALPVEGVLNPSAKPSEARVRGEAPAAPLPEGVLNPINGVLNPINCFLPVEALLFVMSIPRTKE